MSHNLSALNDAECALRATKAFSREHINDRGANKKRKWRRHFGTARRRLEEPAAVTPGSFSVFLNAASSRVSKTGRWALFASAAPRSGRIGRTAAQPETQASRGRVRVRVRVLHGDVLPVW